MYWYRGGGKEYSEVAARAREIFEDIDYIESVDFVGEAVE